MYRWLLFLLLLVNLGVFVWGWQTDTPPAPPPLAAARLEIRLLSELPPPPQAAEVPTEPAAETQTVPGPEAQPAAPPPTPISAYDHGDDPVGTGAPLPETATERVDPGLMPDELVVEPPVVVLPARDDQGPMHTWSR